MYLEYFGLKERPFSIAPDPQYLYMSARHKEAMAHLSYGLMQGGCFIVLTGEVGTGKTTLCRNLLNDLPSDVDVALILNANINEQELLQSVCDELKVDYQDDFSQKKLLDQIYQHLLLKFADNRQTVLIIDEAQLLQRDVLEQIRLLTNLETTKSKLLQIILIGQPELNDVLSRNDLRQLAQRVTARYHLGALEKNEIAEYVNFRLGVAGGRKALFSKQALSKLHSLTDGIPRRINVLADQALLAAYSKTQAVVDSKCIKEASTEVFIQSNKKPLDFGVKGKWLSLAALLIVLNIGLWAWFVASKQSRVEGLSSSNNKETSSNVVAQNTPAKVPEVLSAEEASTSPNQSLTPASDSQPLLTTIVADPDVRPGEVVISDEFLDDEPALVNPVPPPVERLVYDANSAFGKTLDASADVSGRIAAFRTLAQAWDAELPEQILGPVCEELKSNAVHCADVGSWGQLKRFNRPAILVLEQGNQFHRVILFSLQGPQAQVLIGDQVVNVSESELRSRWNKNGIVFWKPVATTLRFLQEGDRDTNLGSLRLRLNQALATLQMPLLQNVESTIFDGDMAQKVFALQSRFNIIADGKIGIETHLLINEILAAELTPTLQPRVKSS